MVSVNLQRFKSIGNTFEFTLYTGDMSYITCKRGNVMDLKTPYIKYTFQRKCTIIYYTH